MIRLVSTPERQSWWLLERCQSLLACSPQRWTCDRGEILMVPEKGTLVPVLSHLYINLETTVENSRNDCYDEYFPCRTEGHYWVLPATEELHAKERKDDDEEEEEEDEGDDGLHGVHQRHDQVSQRSPVPSQGTKHPVLNVPAAFHQPWNSLCE